MGLKARIVRSRGTRKGTPTLSVMPERERLKTSFRHTLDLMERMGSDRRMLLEVIQEVLDEERAQSGPERGTRG